MEMVFPLLLPYTIFSEPFGKFRFSVVRALLFPSLAVAPLIHVFFPYYLFLS